MEFKTSRKLLITSLGLLLAAPTYASPFDGFNIEALGGSSVAHLKTNETQVSPLEINNFGLGERITIQELRRQVGNFGINEGIAELRLGYGKVIPCSRLYLGAEIFGNYSQRRYKVVDPAGNLPSDIAFETVTRQELHFKPFEYGADLKPGFLISPTTLLVGHIGAAFDRIKLQSSAELSIPRFGLDNVTLAESKKDLTGLLLGLGIDQYICNNFSVNLDYLYTTYGHVSLDNVSSLTVLNHIVGGETTIPNSSVNQFHSKIHNNRIMLGLNYHFQPCSAHTNCCAFNYCPPRFTGWYTTLSLGDLNTWTKIRGDQFLQLNVGSPTFQEFKTQNGRVSSDSLIGQLALGYGKQCNRFYLGGEVFLNAAKRNLSFDSRFFNGFATEQPINIDNPDTIFPEHFDRFARARLNSVEYGADLLPGLLITPCTLATVRVGAAYNKTRYETVTHYDNFIPQFISFDMNGVTSKHRTGLRLGAGLKQYICNGISLTADYIYTDYGHVNLTTQTESITFDTLSPVPNGFQNISRANRLSSQAVMFGVSYRFSSCIF